MDADEQPIRLNSSSRCGVCNRRARRYLRDGKGGVVAVCDRCDCDSNNPIAYNKKKSAS